jgi:hypothetical protein
VGYGAKRRAHAAGYVSAGASFCVLLEINFVLFSARLDETGTDGRSPYTLVGGAVSTPAQWDRLEQKWSALLHRTKVDAFHFKEFQEGSPPFNDWSAFKRKRFVERQEKIIGAFTLFRISIGIEHAIHRKIKDRMKGIAGFRPDSDYGLCLRYLMFATSEQLLKVDSNHRLSIMVEDGPWSEGAYSTYRKVAAMTGKWKPAKHAHRLAGFAAIPKGESTSLEAADYIVGSEHKRFLEGRESSNTKLLSMLLNGRVLEQWYERMMREKNARRAYGNRAVQSSLTHSANKQST